MGLSNEAKESLLQAMDIIANKAAEKLPYDSTIKATVVNSDNASDGYYTVQYENTKFTAYSEKSSYKVGDCVRVSIPNNDFSEQKFILGKWVEDASKPITYTSVANTVLEIFSLVNKQNIVNTGIEANGDEAVITLDVVPDLTQFFEQIKQNNLFDTVFIEAGFQTYLNSVSMASGAYGVRLKICDRDNQIITTLELDSSEFFGNPYSYNIPIVQSKKLSISDLEQIGSVQVELYQDNNFSYYPVNSKETKELESVGAKNIFVKSLHIGFGSDLSQVEDNTPKLFCKNNLTYSRDTNTREKDIGLLWFNKTTDNTYVGFSDGIATKQVGTERFNYSNYDENFYLTKTEEENLLKTQISDTTPLDKKSLLLKAKVRTKGAPAVKQAYSILSKDIPQTLQDLMIRMNGSDKLVGDGDTDKEAGALTLLKNQIASVSGEFDDFMERTQNTYSIQTYSQGDILTKSEYDAISFIEFTTSDKDVVWKSISSLSADDKKSYFSTTDYLEYVIKKDIKTKIKKSLKIFPVEQQILDVLTYGRECQDRGRDTSGKIVAPCFDIIKEIYKIDYNFIQLSDIDPLITSAIGHINTCITTITNLVNSSLKSYQGLWTSQKEKLEKLKNELTTQQNIIKENIPTISFITENKNDIGVTVQLKDLSGTVVSTVKYTLLESKNPAWKSEDWESTFNHEDYDNLYSIYWFQHVPGWKPLENDSEKNNKIFFEDWKNISPTVQQYKKKYTDNVTSTKKTEIANLYTEITTLRDAIKNASGDDKKNKITTHNTKIDTLKKKINALNKYSKYIISFCGLQKGFSLEYNKDDEGFTRITSGNAWTETSYNVSKYDEDQKLGSKNLALITFSNTFLNSLPSHINFGLPSIEGTDKSIEYWNKSTIQENIQILSKTLNKDLATERFKIVIVYNHTKYESKELVFTNESLEKDLSLAAQDNHGFYIKHNSNSKDNYQDNYNFTGVLISKGDKDLERSVVAGFKDPTDQNTKVFNNSWIYWYVPKSATMLSFDDNKLLGTGTGNYNFYTDKYTTVKCTSGTKYYTHQMMEQTTKDEDEKVVLYTKETINGVDYYHYNRKHSYYLKSDSIKWAGQQLKIIKNDYDRAKAAGKTTEANNAANLIIYSCDIPENEITTTNGIKTFKSNHNDIIQKACNKNLFFPKEENATYYYYKTTTLSFTFDEKISLLASEMNTLYPNLYLKLKGASNARKFENLVEKTIDKKKYVVYTEAGKEDEKYFLVTTESGVKYYKTIKQMNATCDGVYKTSNDYSGSSFFFLDNSVNIRKPILITVDGGRKEHHMIDLYPTSDSTRFMSKNDLKAGDSQWKIGFSGKTPGMSNAQVYQYRLDTAGNSSITKDTLIVIKEEFKDALSGKTYYKQYDSDKFLLKSKFGVETPTYSKNDYYCYYKKVSDDDSKKFYYKIKNTFNQDATNNTIMCGIDGEAWTVDQTLATKTFTFGTFGSNGTEYSIQVTPSRTITAGANSNKADIVKTVLNISLHNGTGEEQEFSRPIFSWVGPTCCMEESTVKDDYDGKGYIATFVSTIENKSDLSKYFSILKIEIELDSVRLESYYPIPYVSKINNASYELDGSTSIIYNSYGGVDPNYCVDPYSLYKVQNNSKTYLNNDDVVWSMQYVEGGHGELPTSVPNTSANANKIRYMPRLQGNILEYIDLFIDNAQCYPAVVCKDKDTDAILWIQPILILQNRFLSTTLNKWDNKFQIDEEGGTILSSMLGAGKKNSDNSFSGVLMGDVAEKAGYGSISQVNTGLYGFHEGAMSFGFTIDGTAFLGKSGKGRISFDGNKGIISSALWDGAMNDYGITAYGTQGMLIDLENGHIDAHDFRLTSQNIGLDSNPIVDDNYGDYGHYIRIGNLGLNGDPKTRGYISLDSNGTLDIKVNNLHLTEQIGTANLLKQSKPTFSALQYETISEAAAKNLLPASRWEKVTETDVKDNLHYYVRDKSNPTIYYFESPTNGYSKLYKIEHNKENIYKKNSSGEAIRYWDVDNSLEDPVVSVWKSTKNTKTIGVSSFKFKENNEVEKDDNGKITKVISVKDELTSVEAICIKTDRDDEGEKNEPASIYQDIVLKEKEKYTISGFVRRSKQSVVGDVQYWKNFSVTVSNSTNFELSEANLNLNNSIEINNQEWFYFEKTVIITEDSSTETSERNIRITFECPADFYLYHAKVEQGSIATGWTLSAWDVNQGIVLESSSYNAYLNQDKIFERLITDNATGQPMVGIWMIDTDPITGDSLEHKELYINATYIATGVLRSRNWDGTLKLSSSPIIKETKPDGTIVYELDSFGRKIYTYEINSPPSKGMYINLDLGKIWAAKFELNAWTHTDGNYGIYLNSHPAEAASGLQYYLQLGQEDKSYITFDKNGALKMKVNYFELTSAPLGSDNLLSDTGPLADPVPSKTIYIRNTTKNQPYAHWGYDDAEIVAYVGDNSVAGGRGKCICIYNKKTVTYRSFYQDLDQGLSSSGQYVLSGWINIGEKQTIGNIKFYLRPKAGSTSEECLVYTYTPKNRGWNYFYHIFDLAAAKAKLGTSFTEYDSPRLAIRDYNLSTIENGAVKEKESNPTWFNQLKLEPGTVAGQWCESNQDKKDRVNIYDTEILLQEEVFNKLTDNGTSKGIFLTTDGQLYINATYIAAGVLRSTNFQGTFGTVTVNGKTYETVKTCTAGMFIDLNGGKIRAVDLTLEAGTKSSTSTDFIGLYSSDQADGMAINNSGSLKTWRIIAGHSFGVTKAGKLYAAGAEISGTVNIGASSKIAGWDISSSQIYKSIKVGNTTYKAYLNAIGASGNPAKTAAFAIEVKEDGKDATYPFFVRYDGSIQATKLTVSWNDLDDKPTLLTEGRVTEITNTAISTANISADNITSGTLDASDVTITNLTVSNANITSLSVGKLTTGSCSQRATFSNINVSGGGNIGVWNVSSEGGLYSDGELRIAGIKYLDFRAWMHAPGDDAEDDRGKWVYSVQIKAPTESKYTGVFMVKSDGSCSASGFTDLSDRRLKTDFESIDKYEEIFYDLKPITYTLKHDPIKVRHCGFIAQDIVETLQKYNINEQIFYSFTNNNGDLFKSNDIHNQRQYSLQYNNFTVLNTYMIQKCLKRIEELENEISILKNK